MADKSISIKNSVSLNSGLKSIKDKVIEVAGNIVKDSDSKNPIYLMPEIVATHSDVVNHNWGYYPEKGLRETIDGWIKPFKKPILFDHDEHMAPLGRIIGATFKKTPIGFVKNSNESMLYHGTGRVQLLGKITSKDAIEKVLDGTYLTGSIHGKTDKMVCSICDSDWAENPCDHKFGKTYRDTDSGENVLCYWIAGDKWRWKEWSFVNGPADELAQVFAIHDGDKEDLIKVYNYKDNAFEGKASDSITSSVKYYVIKDSTQEIISLNENTDVARLEKLYGKVWTPGTSLDEETMETTTVVNTETKTEATTTATAVAADKTADTSTTVTATNSTTVEGANAGASTTDKSGTQQGNQVTAQEKTNEQTIQDAVKEITDQLTKTKAELAVANKDKNDLTEAVKLAMSERETLDKELQTNKETLAKVRVEARDAKNEKDTLLEQNIKLQAQVRDTLVEHILELKERLGLETYAKAEDKEEAKKAFVARSIESIQDSLKDLMESAKKTKLSSIPTIGTLTVHDSEPKSEAEKVSEIVDKMSTEDMLHTLLRIKMPEVRA